MKRAALFLAAALAAFVAPYLVTERDVFFSAPAAPADLGAAEQVVRGLLARLPEAYAAGSAAPAAAAARPEALARLERDLGFLRARGRRLELALRSAEVRGETGADGRVRVRTRETWTSREDGAARETTCSAVYLVEQTGAGPRVAAWEISP